jgi:hypothetical protein
MEGGWVPRPGLCKEVLRLVEETRAEGETREGKRKGGGREGGRERGQWFSFQPARSHVSAGLSPRGGAGGRARACLRIATAVAR